jgi:D-serine deaminase-like pyridoxal phosphate-dependent protein
LDTPALLLDLAAFERNVVRMATFFADKPATIRPHSKTHKCPQVSLRQLEAGATGITCAKVSEAEVMADAGIRDILVANQVVGFAKIDRATDLAARCDLMVAVDDAANVQQLSEACQAKGVTLRVLVEVDVGMGRCGLQPGPSALELARQVDTAPGLKLAGLMGYEGHLVMVEDATERARRVQAAFDPMAETIALLERHGLAIQIVSSGGTGTYDVTGTLPFVTEIQCGSYVFMDSTYLKIRPEFEPALTVLATIVSRPVPERVVIDAGLKAMSKEFGWPVPTAARGLAVRYLSEEHGVLDVEPGAAFDGKPGDRVRFLPSHCCTTTNLHDMLHIIQEGVLVDLWPIAARGCVQ